MSCIPSAYRGPVLLMAVGCSFATLGAIPVAVTMAVGTRGSATIIGMGFVGFGFMLILPGLCWCFLVNRRKYAFWRKRRRTSRNQGQEETPALSPLGQSMYGGTDDAEDGGNDRVVESVLDDDEAIVIVMESKEEGGGS